MYLPRHGHRTTGYVPTMFTKWQEGVELLEIAPDQHGFLQHLMVHGWPGGGAPLNNPGFVWNGLAHLQFHQVRPRALVNNRHGWPAEVDARGAHLITYFEDVSANELPRELVSVYAVGRLHQLQIHADQNSALRNHAEFGPVRAGTVAAANAVMYTGRSLGKFLGLIDQNNAPTPLFHEFF